MTPEKQSPLGRQRRSIPVTLIVRPRRIRRDKRADVLDGQILELAIGGEWRNQIALAPRAGAKRHPAPFLPRNRPGFDKLVECGDGLAEHSREGA